MATEKSFCVSWFVLASAVAAAQDLTQHHVFTFDGVQVADGLGSAVLEVGDLDGDGVAELAIGAPRPIGDAGGSVRVVSGATGKLLSTIEGPPPSRGSSPRFGAALALLPDLDEDGLGELVVGLPRDDAGGLDAGAIEIRGLPAGELLVRVEGFMGERLGFALAVAELDGEELPELIAGAPGGDLALAWSGQWLRAAAAGGDPPGDGTLLTVGGSGGFGTTVAVLGDLDGDGREDFAVGAPSDSGAAGPWAGSVTVLSGASGGLLARLEGLQSGDVLGTSLARVASLDGDDLDELAAGAPGAGVDRRGRLWVWSGVSLMGGGPVLELLSLEGSEPEEMFGARVVGLEDVTGDGLPELAVASSRADAASGAGHLAVLSGADGAPVFELPAITGDDALGSGLGVTEVAGGGAPELFVGSPFAGTSEAGVLRSISLDALTLTSDRHRIEVDAGGIAHFSIDAGPGVGGHFYVVLGTFSGTSPGLPSPVGTLGINFDAYSIYSLTNPAELVSFNGFLDPAGRTQAQVALPSGSSANLTQFQLHFGVFTVDFSDPTLQTTAVSNSVPLGFDIDDCFTSDPELDCNGNGVLDVCEIADGSVLDCNADGRPDECDLGLPGFDEDGDGLLDSCRTVVRVDVDALGVPDGTSWASAYTNLAQAIALAPPFAELWVAEGTYRPWGDASNDGASFFLREGMALFGGFSGVELTRDERDPDLHPTVLSGDIGQDDGQPGGSNAENSWNVVATDEGVGPTTRLEGFIVEGGNAKGIAGCDVFNVFFRSCRGGGLYTLGSPTVRDCVFRGNFGGHHGGAVFTLGSPSFVDCRFESNDAIRGGGLYADLGARPRLLNCVLLDNEAFEGGALYAVSGPEDGFSLNNCLVAGNRSLDGGAGLFMQGGSLTAIHCTFAFNTAETQGGGIRGLDTASVSISNSILWGNQAPLGTLLEAQLHVPLATSAASCVEGGPGGLAGFGNVAGPPQFVDPIGLDGQPGTADDDLRLLATSPCVDSGSGLVLPVDLLDLDLDGVLDELLPLDLDRLLRVVDDPSAANVGIPTPSGGWVDMGAFERQ